MNDIDLSSLELHRNKNKHTALGCMQTRRWLRLSDKFQLQDVIHSRKSPETGPFYDV